MAGAAPGTLAGLWLLNLLAGDRLSVLQLLLGLLIAGAAVQLSLATTRRPQRSPPASFAAAGCAGAVMAGLFAAPGPPII